MTISYTQILSRLLLSTAIGGLIGLEREMSNRPAGFRTHILLTLGSCLTMIVSMYAFETTSPGRIGSQVISGIGFLCAGTILKEGDSIVGLTSAATLWLSGAIGLAVGSGMIVASLITFIIAMIALTVLNKIERRVAIHKLDILKKRKSREKEATKDFYKVEMTTLNLSETLSSLDEVAWRNDLRIYNIEIKSEKLYKKIILNIESTEDDAKIQLLKLLNEVSRVEKLLVYS